MNELELLAEFPHARAAHEAFVSMPWGDVREACEFMAKDKSGNTYAWINRPNPNDAEWFGDTFAWWVDSELLPPYYLQKVHWTKSLRQRPEVSK